MNSKGNMTTEQSNPFAGTFAFFQTLNHTHKKQKSLQANAQGQCIMTRHTFARKEAQQVTHSWRQEGIGFQHLQNRLDNKLISALQMQKKHLAFFTSPTSSH